MGSGTDLVGVWRHSVPCPDNDCDEWHFRADNTFTCHWDDGQDYFGTYTVSADQLSIRELRYILTSQGNTITFDPPYGTDQSGTYTVASDVLTITFATYTIVYNRIP